MKRLTPNRRVLTFFANDGRLFFLIPMGPVSCIGTIDTRVHTPETHVTEEDRDFVLANINKNLKLKEPLTRLDILAERCGVRPLVVKRSQGDTLNQEWTSLSRKHAIEFDHEKGFCSVFGGKLTDCLNVGREITGMVEKFGVKLSYHGASWFGEPHREIRDQFFHRATLLGLDAMTAKESSEPLSNRLWRRYGWGALSLLEDIRYNPPMAEVLITGTEYIRCKLHHAAEHEMVTRFADFLRRHSKIALIARADEIRSASGLMEACGILFGDRAKIQFDEYFEGASR